MSDDRKGVCAACSPAGEKGEVCTGAALPCGCMAWEEMEGRASRKEGDRWRHHVRRRVFPKPDP